MLVTPRITRCWCYDHAHNSLERGKQVTFFSVIASPSALMKAIKFCGTISAIPRPGLRPSEFRRPRAMFVATFRWRIRSNVIVSCSLETLQSTYSCYEAAAKDDGWTFFESYHWLSFPRWSSLTKRRSSASRVESL
jgi:hypothetical protein